MQRCCPSKRQQNHSAGDEGSGAAMDRETAGIALREKRASLGLSLDDVARATLLRKAVLASMESGGPPEPNGFFRSYARRYAGFLGLDGDEVVAAFSSRTVREAPEVIEAATPMPQRERARKNVSAFTRKRGLGPVVFIIIVALTAAVILLSKPWAGSAPSQGGQSTPSNTAPSSSTPSETTPASGSTTTSGAGETGTTTQTGILTLRFSATTQRAWLEITADEQVVFSGILRPGDSTQATGRYIVVDFGNAMYTHVAVNGVDQGLVSPDKTVMTVEYGSPPAQP